ncbi:hypothetical protein [Ktedonospora formicarum]|uniref:hypothetical protein n=1 Tax=Ktedonospora formicarum TaxID=2778364 RepID=UPI001C68CB14|nr:hypothetical protein [Ktedonospora formicarum]
MEHQELTCLVTIHGIGFQQPPIGRISGYADRLHAHLNKHLNDSQLSSDPLRDYCTRAGGDGPIYVQSCWPSGTRHREAGLARLGVWSQGSHSQIDTTNAPLTNGKGCVSHVALVYSDIEENVGRVLPTLNASLMTLCSFPSYISPLRLGLFFKKTVPPYSQDITQATSLMDLHSYHAVTSNIRTVLSLSCNSCKLMSRHM